MIVKNLNVKVSYRVGLGNVEMPEKVYKQLLEASNNDEEIDPCGSVKYNQAADWLSNNIKERDCADWEAQIVDISIERIS